MKGMKRFFSVMFALTLIVATAAGSYATSAPGWYLNKGYHEGDYVKFRGGIYIVTKDHESSQDKYPGNSAYWTFYKKGAGFKKDAPPTENDYEKPNDRDRDDDRNDGRFPLSSMMMRKWMKSTRTLKSIRMTMKS